MEHPLVTINPELSVDQLQNKITELNRKLGMAYRQGNAHLIAQIRMALESYSNCYRDKLAEISNKSRDNGVDFSSQIDIS
jgi:hypothetical protein